MQTNRVNYPSVVYKTTAPAVLAFPNLFTPRAFQTGDKEKYDVRIVFPAGHPDLQPISDIMGQLKQQSFPSATIFDYCLRSGDQMAAEAVQAGKKPTEFYRGKFVLTARTGFLDKRSLGVILNGAIAAVPPAPDSAAFEQYFYGGVEAYAELDLHCYPAIGTRVPPGVSCWPKSVLSLNRGEHIPEINGGATVSAAASWSHLQGHVSAFDPTAAAGGPLSGFV